MRVIRRFLVLAVALFAVSGAAFAQSTIDKIKDEGVLKVGMADSVPMQYKDTKSGEWRGFNVDMANNLADVLGVKLEIVDATWATLIPGLMGKQWDICLVDMFATPQRAVTVMFTDPYFQTRQVVLGNSESGIETWEQLNSEGNSIAVLAGTADEQVAKDNFPKATVKPMVAEGLAATFLEVAAGRAQASVAAELNIKLYLAENPNAPLAIIDPTLGVDAQGYAYAIRPGDTHFLNFLNTWILSNRLTGVTEATEVKWIDNFQR